MLIENDDDGDDDDDNDAQSTKCKETETKMLIENGSRMFFRIICCHKSQCQGLPKSTCISEYL